MGDFDNLAAEMTRRERNHAEVRNRAASVEALTAWTDYCGTIDPPYVQNAREAFLTAFDLARDSTPEPINYARIAVLQTEREVLRRQMERDGTPKTSAAPSAERYWAIDKEIREALT